MFHINDHLANLTPAENMRPDFWVIEHMMAYGLISPEDYAYALQGTERPPCNNFLPPQFAQIETQEMFEKRERNSRLWYDLEHEERHRKRQIKKGKSHYGSASRRPRKSYEPPIVNLR